MMVMRSRCVPLLPQSHETTQGGGQEPFSIPDASSSQRPSNIC